MIESIGKIMSVANLASEAFESLKSDDHVASVVEDFIRIEEDHPIATLSGVAGGEGAKGVQNPYSPEAKESSLVNRSEAASQDEIQQRLIFAKLSVSIWAHCCRADGKLAEEEDQLTNLMIVSLFEADSLLAEVPNRDLACRELVETFNDPFPLKAIAEVIRDMDEIVTSFYQQACLIMSIDGSIKLSEREFLNNLASEFNISQLNKKSIEQQHLKLS